MTQSYAALARAAADVLARNDTGVFVKPGPRQYPGQWNWDAALITIGLARLDAGRARHEVRSLLRGQWQDGMVPHIVFHSGDVDYFPGPDVWGAAGGSPKVPTSGITQPPLMATAVRRLHGMHPSDRFLEEVVPALDRWHRWFQGRRHPDSGLVSILHPWESGMDNSPRFDRALRAVPPPETVPARRDLLHVPADQRPLDADYAAYVSILETLRESGYRPVMEEAPFLVGDVCLTAILARAEEDMAWLWTELGETGREAMARSKSLRASIEGSWDETTGLYRDTGGDDAPSTIGGVLPVIAATGGSRLDRTIGQLWDPTRFGPSRDAPWHPTSVAKADSRFDCRRYWRGPVWVNVNWLLVGALGAAGRGDDAERLRGATLDLVWNHGFWEYYDPRTGEGLGSGTFSWTAAAVLDLLADR